MDYRRLTVCALLCNALAGWAQTENPKDSLTMESVMHDLPEVMVKGSRPIVKAERGMLSYNMPQLLKQLPADNAYEALTRIPGVSDADGGIKFSGNEVTLIINGKPTTLTQEQLADRLKAMPAAQLAKAELMLSAPARLHVRGTAINIVTKDNAGTHQVAGQLVGAWQQSRYGLGYGKGNLTVQQGKLGLDAQYSFNAGHSFGYTATDANQRVDGQWMAYDEEVRQKSQNTTHNYRLGMSYDFAPKHRLDVAYTGKWNSGHSRNRSLGTGTSEVAHAHHVYLHNVDMNYSLPFGLQLSGSYTHYRTPQSQQLDGTLNEAVRNLTTESKQTIDKWMFSADQSLSFRHGWGVSLGAQAQFARNNSWQTTCDAQGNELPDATSNVDFSERIWNFYAGFSKQFSQAFSLEASVAAEQYHSPQWDEWRVYPTLNALWTVSPKHVLNLSFSSNSEYPPYWATMSNVFYTSTYKEIWGNPDLKPFSYYSVNLMWQYNRRYTLTAFASLKPDYSGQLPYLPSDRMAVVMQEINYDYNHSFGLQASAMFNVGSWLSGNAYSVLSYHHDKGSHFFDQPFDRERVSLLVGGTASLKLCAKEDLRLILSPFYQTKAIQGVYDIRPIFRMNASLRWTSRDGKWGVRINGDNIFNTKYKTNVRQDGQSFRLTTTPGWVTGAVAVIYKFGNYKEKKVKAVDTSRMGH